METRVQRFIRSHPYWAAEWIKGKFPSKSIEEIEREQNFAFDIWKPTTYFEIAIVDDDGEYDEDGFKSSGETQYIGPTTGYAPMSEWTRRRAAGMARLIEYKDWVHGEQSGSIWADRVTAEVERRIVGRLHRMGRRSFAQWLVDRKSTCPPFKESFPSWTPPAVIRVSSVRHVAPLPGPAQATEDSYWNIPHCRKGILLKRSLNLFEPAPPSTQPTSFDAAIGDTIGATIVANDNSDNDLLKEAA
jgi:hypothetical protein